MKTALSRFVPAVLIAALLVPTLAALTGCSNKAQQGAVIGGLAGAALGGQLGPADERRQNALIGALAGVTLGYIIGNEWDKYDQRKLNNTLENTPSGQTNAWVNPDTGREYAATPYPAYRDDGRVYRDVEIEGYVDGKREVVHAKAYRDEYGNWQLVQ